MNKRVIITAGMEDNSRKDVRDALRCVNSVKEALARSGIEAGTLFFRPEDLTRGKEHVAAKIKSSGPDCVFNLFEGYSDDSGKEIEFARILEETGVPFTGSRGAVLEACRDKKRSKDILRASGVNVPEGFVVERMSDLEDTYPECPLFIKPRCEDASVGIDAGSLVTEQKDIKEAVRRKLEEFPEGLIVEEFIPGREFNAGYIGVYPYELVGVSVMDYEECPDCYNFMSYMSKWEESAPDFSKLVPKVVTGEARADKDVKQKISEIGREAARALGCRGYFRIDMREKNGVFYVLDVNPNPDINEDSGFMRQVYTGGYTYQQMINRIIDLAG
ncbi:MAG: ATP-grasp domain-containing protein [Candidatus Omnitrophota bacterium]